MLIADVNQIDVAFCLLGMGRICDKLTIHPADADSAERSIPRNITHGQRGACTDDAEDIRVIFTIRTENDGLDLDFVVPAFGGVA